MPSRFDILSSLIYPCTDFATQNLVDSDDKIRGTSSPGGGRVVQWCWVNFQCWGVLLIWIVVGQGPSALAVGAGGGCLDIFLSSINSLVFLPLSGRRPDID